MNSRARTQSRNRFFAVNAAKMDNIHKKKRQMKAAKEAEAPIKTMEALRNAFSTGNGSASSSQASNQEASGQSAEGSIS